MLEYDTNLKKSNLFVGQNYGLWRHLKCYNWLNYDVIFFTFPILARHILCPITSYS